MLNINLSLALITVTFLFLSFNLIHSIKYLGDADTSARKEANTLHNVGEYAALGSALTGSDTLSDVGNRLTKLLKKIRN